MSAIVRLTRGWPDTVSAEGLVGSVVVTFELVSGTVTTGKTYRLVEVTDIDAETEGKARRDHPETAKAAAKTIGKVGTQRRRVYETIRYWSSNGIGATDEDIASWSGLPPNSIRPRRVELVEGGHVKDSGFRRKTIAGKDAIVWVVT